MFSIIVPMYNVVQYAEKCINSIICQSYENFELIIVDDGSTDGTRDIIEKYTKKDERIRVVYKKNGGPTSARKAGAEIAKNEYILIIDGDDWIDRDYLLNIADTINKTNPDIVICGYTKSCDNHEQKREYNGLAEGVYLSDSVDFNRFLNNKLIYSSPTLWAKCFKTSNYIKAQNKVENWINMGEDGCISYPLIAYAHKISVISDYGYHYRYNPTSLTRNKTKVISFQSAVWRIKHLRSELPSSIDMDKQVAAFVSHSLFNVIMTNMRIRKYKDVVHEAKKQFLDSDIAYYLKIKKIKGSKKEMISHLIIRLHLFFLIKIYLLIIDGKER